MKFTCKRDDLHEALKVVGRAVSERSSLPILHNILIRPTGDNEVTLAASDLELSIHLRIPATVEEPAPLSLPAKTLSEFVGGLGEGELTVEVDERNKGLIRMKKTKFNILGLPAEEFPPLPVVADGTFFSVAEGKLARLIRSVAFAVSDDTTRPILTAVHLQLTPAKGGPVLRFAATDTHRLSVRSCTVEEGSKQEASCLVPLRALTELLKSLHPDGEGLVQVRFDGNQIEFATVALTMVSRLIDGQFPKFERVIPTTFASEFSIPTAELLPIITRAAIVAKANSNKVSITVKPAEGVAVIAAKSGEVGEIEDEVPLAWIGDQTERVFIVNFRFLVDVLSLKDSETARFEVNEPTAPMLFRSAPNGEWSVVIMPMSGDM